MLLGLRSFLLENHIPRSDGAPIFDLQKSKWRFRVCTFEFDDVLRGSTHSFFSLVAKYYASCRKSFDNQGFSNQIRTSVLCRKSAGSSRNTVNLRRIFDAAELLDFFVSSR